MCEVHADIVNPHSGTSGIVNGVLAIVEKVCGLPVPR